MTERLKQTASLLAHNKSNWLQSIFRYPDRLRTGKATLKGFSLTILYTTFVLMYSRYQRGSVALALELRMHTQ